MELMMKKKMFLMTVLLCGLGLFTLMAQSYPELNGAVAAISKYGNLELDMAPAAMKEAGFEYGDMLEMVVGESVVSAPFCTSYSDVDTGSALLRDDLKKDILVVAINMGNFSGTYQVEVGDSITVKLVEKSAYLNEYLMRQLERSNERSDYESDEVFANFREVRGGDIALGTLYRSSSPVNNELGRAAWSDDLAEAATIATVVNLADSQEEIESYVAAEGFDSPYYLSLYEAGQVKYLDMGVDFASDGFGSKLAEGMRFIATHEGPYLIHCTEGKDRAGFASAILEGLMGASIDEIVEDYMISFTNYYGVEKGSEQYEAIAKSNIVTSISLLLGYDEAVDLSNENLAKAFKKYLLNYGLSKKEIRELKGQLR
jgi:hypothetical protein